MYRYVKRNVNSVTKKYCLLNTVNPTVTYTIHIKTLNLTQTSELDVVPCIPSTHVWCKIMESNLPRIKRIFRYQLQLGFPLHFFQTVLTCIRCKKNSNVFKSGGGNLCKRNQTLTSRVCYAVICSS